MHGLLSLTAKATSAKSSWICCSGWERTKHKIMTWPRFMNPRCVDVMPFLEKQDQHSDSVESYDPTFVYMVRGGF
jgi:hypothetical protein